MEQGTAWGAANGQSHTMSNCANGKHMHNTLHCDFARSTCVQLLRSPPDHAASYTAPSRSPGLKSNNFRLFDAALLLVRKAQVSCMALFGILGAPLTRILDELAEQAKGECRTPLGWAADVRQLTSPRADSANSICFQSIDLTTRLSLEELLSCSLCLLFVRARCEAFAQDVYLPFLPLAGHISILRRSDFQRWDLVRS